MSSFIQTKISIGEYYDKLSILYIKKEWINDTSKLKFIEREINELGKDLQRASLSLNVDMLKELINVNKSIWKTEDKLRNLVNSDEKFAKAAHDNAKFNDLRFVIKQKINKEYDSTLQEQKSYEHLGS